MSLSRIKVWIPGDILTAADLNAEFNNLLNNPISLVSPTTGAINFNLQAHTGILPVSISASSGNAGDALVISTGNASIWATPTRNVNIPLTPGAAIFSSGLFPNLLKTTDSNFPTYTLQYHSSVKESAYWYVTLTSALSGVSSATLQLNIACTSSGGLSVWQVNTRMVQSGSTWNILGSTDVGSTFTVGAAGDITLMTIPLTATSWSLPGILQVRVDRTTDTSNTSTGLYLHGGAIKVKV